MKTKLLDTYCCVLVSDKDVRRINVAASSFGDAASTCHRVISSWENKDSYSLTKIQLCEPIFIKIVK